MQYYIHHNNQQIGPFTEAEVKAQLAAGSISPQDHVWWQGQQGWVPLAQSSLMAQATPGLTPPSGAIPVAAPYVGGVIQPTSKLAIWALVCGCLSLVCGIFSSIPAIVLGHMGLSEIKKNPALQGRGMALAGAILGYVFTALIAIYLIAIVVLLSLGHQVQDVFKTIQAQENASTNSADLSATPSDQSTNSPDQSTATPSTNSPDQSTNSATATPATPDQSTNSASTNAPDSTTNAAPASQ